MARIRTIKPEFFTSEQIVDCSTIARLLFVGMWCFADDGGVHPASVKRLKMEVFPADDLTVEQVSGMVQELIDADLVELYECCGESFWRVKGWHHQKIENPTYRYPRSKEFGDISSTRRRGFADVSTTEGSLRESKGRESKGSKRHARNVFIKPTTAEVTAYCTERDNGIDPEQFVDHYETRGWKLKGGVGMKDWKAAIRTWEKNDINKKPESRVATAEDLANYNPHDGGLGG